MAIKLPEILQNFGNNTDLLEKWLQQMATVRIEMPKERYNKLLQIMYVKSLIYDDLLNIVNDISF